MEDQPSSYRYGPGADGDRPEPGVVPGYGVPAGDGVAHGAAPGPGYGVPGPVPPYPPYGPPPDGPPPYGPPAYGPAPAAWYQPPGYPAPWNLPVPVSRAWPHGPERPGVATAAAVLGFVTGGLTALASLGFLIALIAGEGDLPTGLLVLGAPCAAGMIAGGVQLLRRQAREMLLGSAVAAVVVLFLALIAGAASTSGGDLTGLLVFLLLAAVLPIVTASLAAQRTVAGWLADAGRVHGPAA